MNKLKVLFASILIVTFAVLTPLTYAATAATNAACEGIGAGASSGSCAGDAGSPTPDGVVKSVISILTYIVGVASVIMIIVSAFKYITAGGDANKVGSAKSSLIYALIGLVIVALAQFIIRVVLAKAVA